MAQLAQLIEMLALTIKRLRLWNGQVKPEQRIKELFGDCIQADRQTRMSLNKLRTDRRKEGDDYNEKVKNYHNYEYFRGEDFIENIPHLSDNRYTIQDKLTDQQEKERVSIEELSPMLNHIQRAELIRLRINAYHDKQKKYQIQQFQKYLTEYPGTVRGPKPQDDPEAYRQYALKKMPRVLKEELEQQQAFKVMGKEEEDERSSVFIRSIGTTLGTMDKDRLILDTTGKNKEQEAAYLADFEKGMQNQQVVDGCKSEVPLMPSLEFENYQYFVNYWASWLEFRNSYITHNKEEKIKTLQEETEKLTQTFLEEGEWMDVPSNIPSLYRYYKCLPKTMQDHPGLKDIYLGLQYTSPDFNYEEKEDMLNRVCPLLLPFDPISDRVMTDYTAVSRAVPSIYIHEKIHTISPQFTWDMGQFLDEIRKQELRGETTNQDKDAMYPAPPEVHKMWEEGAPNLPVDFYDNEDGFWDEIISEKLKRYDEFKPMLKTRKYFTH